MEPDVGDEWIVAKGVRFARFAVFPCGMVLLLSLSLLPRAMARPAEGAPILAFTFGTNILVLWFLWRYSRTGCRIQAGGLFIKNVFGESTIPWARIDHFDEGPAWGFYANFLRVHTTDGEVVPVTGVQQRIESEWMQDVIDRLEAARLSHSAEGP